MKIQFTPVQLTFQDINYKVKIKKPNSIDSTVLIEHPKKSQNVYYKVILKDISGLVSPGSLCAIMGPSGGGKTSLLDVISGRIHPDLYTGQVLVNGKQLNVHAFRQAAGYVPQDDVVMSTLTVRENLKFSADLRLPKSMTELQKQERVSAVLEELGLTRVADTKVGNQFIRGISGGERKRLSIGMELITAPSILFLDEPTTGLDATTAMSVMKTLRKLADQGRCIVCSIHQPRFKIFELFDQLVLLADGQMVFNGKREQVLPYLSDLGYECETFNNPADFLMDVIAIDKQKEKNFDEEALNRPYETLMDYFKQSHLCHDLLRNIQKVQNLKEITYKDSESSLDKTLVSNSEEQLSDSSGKISVDSETGLVNKKDAGILNERVSWFQEFSICSKRAALNVWRNPQTSVMQLFVMIFFAVIVGLIYFNLGLGNESVQNRAGALFFLTMNLVFSSLSAIELFLVERKLFVHEKSNNYYKSSSYYFAKLFSDFLPLRIIPTFIFGTIVYFMVGFQLVASKFITFQVILIVTTLCSASLCFFVSMFCSVFAIANLVVSLFYVFFMVFGGFLLNVNNIPVYFRWLEYLSIFRYAIEAVQINEFSGLIFDCAKNMTSLGGGSAPSSHLPVNNQTTPGRDTVVVGMAGGPPQNSTADPSAFCNFCIPTGDIYLQSQGFDQHRLWWNILILFCMMIAYLTLAYIGLYRIDIRGR